MKFEFELIPGTNYCKLKHDFKVYYKETSAIPILGAKTFQDDKEAIKYLDATSHFILDGRKQAFLKGFATPCEILESYLGKL